ncbi:MAG: YkgJ family cysteine cluster protein [Candidatus Latescibacterota bacterium]
MHDTLPPVALSGALAALYSRVPQTCCQGTGECCRLTPEEYDSHYATMFPLHRAEYLNIVRFVQAELAPERQEHLLSFTEERPRRCPFLGEDNRCTIYPVRPLICRTYGVMSPDSIGRAAVQCRGKVPEEWIRTFVRRESTMVCPRVRVVEPAKLERHVQSLVSGEYERALLALGHPLELAGAERLRLFRQVTGRERWPVCWSWGGYNAVSRASMDWLQGEFAAYWRSAVLADAG